MTEKIYPVRVVKHKTSELLMAVVPDVPGFIVHAYSVDELEDKLGPAFEQFMNATDQHVASVEVIRDDAPAGFWPPAFAARAMVAERRVA